ncbi:MAG: TIGR03984 family CRISPR-associated protein [Clostridiales bacterium]|nr:TIGR03984 family CRISPR-associated protein [Clostridiales bacterium]
MSWSFVDGYKRLFKEITASEIEEEIRANLEENKDYLVLEHKYQGVYIGKYSNGSFYYYDGSGIELENMLEIRIFDLNSELRIIKSGKDKYNMRYINENEKEEEGKVDYYDEQLLLYGTRVKVEGSWIGLYEDNRGIRIYLPSSKTLEKTNKSDPNVFLKVRYYVDFNEDGLMEIVDNRLVEFTLGKKEV